MQISEKYSLTEELGIIHSKQFGRTFLGASKKTGEKVFIKFVSKTEHPNGVGRLKNELLFDFNYPGLPKILDFFESEKEMILVRQYVEGVRLDDYWKKLKRIERTPFLISLFEKINLIFHELSSLSAVHCDLKPSNILIHGSADSFQVGLIDFGLAIRKKEPEERKIIFPLGFAAPELLLNELDLVDHRTDIYALGITTWYLLSEELPLTHPNPSIYTNLQLTHPLPDHSALPKGWYAILKKMTNKHLFRTAPNLLDKEEVRTNLKKGMNERYSTMNEVISELKKLPLPKRWFHFF
jgi:serine/threonine protein kinase